MRLLLLLAHGVGARREGVLVGVGVDLWHRRDGRGCGECGGGARALVLVLRVLRAPSGLQTARKCRRGGCIGEVTGLRGGLVKIGVGARACGILIRRMVHLLLLWLRLLLLVVRRLLLRLLMKGQLLGWC